MTRLDHICVMTRAYMCHDSFIRVQIVPDHVQALCNYGNLLHNHLGDGDKAQVLYTKALAVMPNHTTTLRFVCVCV